MVDEFDFQKAIIQFLIFIKYNGIITMMEYFIKFFLKIEGLHFVFFKSFEVKFFYKLNLQLV